MQPRPPIVTILGHVDHGKTTLLDYIRKSRLADKEHGGITQRIGAYEIATGIKGYKTDKITFIDTPGHEAFSFLRARGANVADLAILIIDAKDSVMPQTIESIYHIKTAKIPFIVALNKSDLPDANPDKVKNDLLKQEVMVEGKGGDTPALPISAKTGQGVQELLEMILLMASDLNLTFDPKADPAAYIIETKKDRRGIVVSAVIKNGQLRIGDDVFADGKKARIRSMLNDLGHTVPTVLPSTPFELTGFQELPDVGAMLTAKPLQQATENIRPETSVIPQKIDIAAFLTTKAEEKKLSLVIKADSQGSLEAINNTLAKNNKVKVILKSVGDVNKSDVFLAKTTGSVIVGFAVNITPEVRELAKQEKVVIKTYNIIYELLEELTEVTELMQEKEEKEKYLKGEAKVLANFIIEGEKIYGVKVTKGKINLGDELELYRQNKQFGKSKLVSLRIRAKSVNEVKKDQEAGMILGSTLDMQIGDVVKSIS